MKKITLVIGNKNYSSWSLRPWLVLRQFDIPFDEVRIPLYRSDSAASLARWSPSGLVPVLKDGDLTVWDSLAICEYLHEKHPEKRLWPEDPAERAVARSLSAEMHSGFFSLRHSMSMSIRAERHGKGRTPEAMKDVERILSLWSECRARHGSKGDFLFGHFTIADAMYAPVVLRFRTYDITLEGALERYVRKMVELPAMQDWVADAKREIERIEQFETDPE